MARRTSLPMPSDDGNLDDRLPLGDADHDQERSLADGAAGGPGNTGEAGDHSQECNADTDFDPAKLEADSSAGPDNRDFFDPAFLGLRQDFAATANVRKVWHTIKVGRPPNSQAFRVHPGEGFRLKAILLVLKEENEVYLVLPHLQGALADEPLCGIHTLFACVTKSGTPFLWHIKMPDADGKWNAWPKSAWRIAQRAQQRWVRMTSNRQAGYYDADEDRRPLDQQQPPAWPELTFSDWLRLGFQGYTIDSLDHPVLKRLRLED